MKPQNFIAGLAILMISGPPMAVVAICSVIWDNIDHFFVGKPSTGVIIRLSKWLNKVRHEANCKIVEHPSDSYMINEILLLGVFVPVLFFLSLWYTRVFGFSLLLCLIYNVIRIGPYYINFAYIYALCHKEGHMGEFLYKPPYNSYLQYVFNWWIGLFNGVLPATFVYGHSLNHHTYNNSEEDIITTADMPRDNFFNWISYLTRFTLYATNISTILRFFKEGRPRIVRDMILGTLYYLVFLYLISLIDWKFALGYVIYPFLESNLFLACTNWCWHAFMDEENPGNVFVHSLTIMNGTFNVLNEDYHVVHHQYPGQHWTRHPELYEKHKNSYQTEKASMFRDVHMFNMFFYIVLRRYDKLAEKYVGDFGEKLTTEETIDLMKRRLRKCSWGPLASRNLKSE